MNIRGPETIVFGLTVSAGLVIGVVFFGGLWWTVSYGLRSKRPALLFSVSLLSRTAFVLVAFYLAGGSRWDRLVACLLGFLGARVLTGWLLPAQPKPRKRKGNECI